MTRAPTLAHHRAHERLLVILRKAIDEAVSEGYVGTNVVDRVKKPKQTPKEMQTWTPDEVAQFLKSIERDPLVGIWHVASLGLRRGELLGLRWSEIDLDAGVARVRQARVQAGKTAVVGDPKTERGRRTVPLHAAAISALRETKRRTLTASPLVPLREKSGGDRLVAVNAIGEPMTPAAISSAFQRHAQRAELRRIRLHDLRHTAVSLLLQQGVPVVTVARLAGHDPR